MTHAHLLKKEPSKISNHKLPETAENLPDKSDHTNK